MSQLPWEPAVAEGAEAQQKADDAGALTLSADEFSALEERIRRAVNQLKQERQARSEADERAARAEAQMREQEQRTAQLETDLTALRAERENVRQRVDRLLTQLDALEL